MPTGSSVQPGAGRLPDGPQRRRQDDADEGDHGHPAPARRLRSRLCWHDMSRWPPYQRARAGIGYVPQGRGIFPYLTVTGEHPHRPRAVRGRDDRRSSTRY